MEVVKGRGYVYSIQYHIVWCVKYRRNVLNGQVATRLKELLTQISKDNGFQILEMNIEEDYIRMKDFYILDKEKMALAKALSRPSSFCRLSSASRTRFENPSCSCRTSAETAAARGFGPLTGYPPL